MGFQQSTQFGKYLGFPIIQGKVSNQEYQFILYNLQSKMAGWKTRFLNIVGKTMLAKSCLNSIPTHITQFHILPASKTNKIDKIKRKFIWWTIDSKRKLHMIS